MGIFELEPVQCSHYQRLSGIRIGLVQITKKSLANCSLVTHAQPIDFRNYMSTTLHENENSEINQLKFPLLNVSQIVI